MLADKNFYMECILTIPDDGNFNLLIKALQKNAAGTAFTYAHTLKGVLDNLAVIPMLNKTVEIVEVLRRGSTDGLLAKAYELDEMRAQLSSILKDSTI